ncbi:MAG: isochorismatase family cysteine hydrolase [Patescibacteria group bacterium]
METHKTALLLIDIQQGFITDENKWVLPNIERLLKEGSYDAHVEVVFSAPEGSLWDKQLHWTFPKQDTVAEIAPLIPKERYLCIEKTTKSAFKGNKDLLAFLKELGIQEVHVIGLDTNDCVFATANEAFDLGFFSYVIEDCTVSSQSAALREAALMILRELDMAKKLDDIL